MMSHNKKIKRGTDMFLNKLSKKEKEAFISLSIHVSNSNGVFADEEKVMIQDYCKEMELPLFDADSAKPMDEVVAVFIESDLHIKKIVLLETLGLVYSDGLYDDAEKEFIEEYANRIGLTNDIVENLTVVIKEYLDVLKKISEVVA